MIILTAADCREEHPALFKRVVLVPYLEFLEKPNKGGRIAIDAACFLLTIFEQVLTTPLKSSKFQKQWCPAQHPLMSATEQQEREQRFQE
jgi:hypothetical protein